VYTDPEVYVDLGIISKVVDASSAPLDNLGPGYDSCLICMPISPPLCTVDNRTTLNVLDIDSYSIKYNGATQFVTRYTSNNISRR
jgi:hypothetical protein